MPIIVCIHNLSVDNFMIDSSKISLYKTTKDKGRTFEYGARLYIQAVKQIPAEEVHDPDIDFERRIYEEVTRLVWNELYGEIVRDLQRLHARIATEHLYGIGKIPTEIPTPGLALQLLEKVDIRRHSPPTLSGIKARLNQDEGDCIGGHRVN